MRLFPVMDITETDLKLAALVVAPFVLLAVVMVILVLDDILRDKHKERSHDRR